MSDTGGNAGESVGAGRDRTGRIGGLAGALGAALMIAGLVTIGALPDPDATAPQVYEFFLEETGEVARPTALLALGLLLTLVMFTTMRAMMSARRGSSVAGATMLALAQVGIGLQVVALTMIGVLTLRPADADPGTSRALLDLSELLAGISGAALALAMIAMALGIRRTPGLLPARFSEAALVVAVGLALWTVRLFSDTETFDAYSILGSSLGWTLLIAWVLAAGVWLLAIRPRHAVLVPSGESSPSRAGEAPATAPQPQATRPQTREERVAQRMPRTSPPPRPPTPPSAPPPRPRTPFVPPPYPETPPPRAEPAPAPVKPATPPDEPATVPPEPESGTVSEAETAEATVLPPEPAPDFEPEPAVEQELDRADEPEPAEPAPEAEAEPEPGADDEPQ